jgi:hypothetical protein
MVALVLATALTGCFGLKTTAQPVTESTVGVSPSGETTGEPTTTPVTSQQPAGEIVSPKTGEKIRTTLMDAARASLDTDAQFVINQLYVMGDRWAVGDIRPSSRSGERRFVAWRGPAWSVVWSSGPGDAGAKALTAAVPDIPAELVARLDWSKPFPVAEAQLRDWLKADAKKWSKQLMSGKGQPYTVTSIKLAQDGKDGWWATVVVQPKASGSNAYEDIWFWCRYKNGAWEGEPVTGGDDRAPSSYFPAEVIGSLGPF